MAEGSDVETGQEESIGCYPLTARLVYANLTPSGVVDTNLRTSRPPGSGGARQAPREIVPVGLLQDLKKSSRLGLWVAVAAATVGIIYGYDSSNIAGGNSRAIPEAHGAGRARSPKPADPQDLSPRASDKEGLMTCC